MSASEFLFTLSTQLIKPNYLFLGTRAHAIFFLRVAGFLGSLNLTLIFSSWQLGYFSLKITHPPQKPNCPPLERIIWTEACSNYSEKRAFPTGLFRVQSFCLLKEGKVCIRAKWPIRPELILGSLAWSDWEYFYYPLDGMLVHCRVTPSIKFAGTHLYTWVESDTVKVESCPRTQHNVPGQGSNTDRSIRRRAH